MMLTDDNQIFRNCFVIIYCHLKKVSSQINKCIIFEPNELSIKLSTLWYKVTLSSEKTMAHDDVTCGLVSSDIKENQWFVKLVPN